VREVRVFGLLTQVAFLATVAVGVEARAAGGLASTGTGGAAAGGTTGSPSGGATASGAGGGSGAGAAVGPERANVVAPAPFPGLGPELASFIGGASACPTPPDVWRELGTLIPVDRLIAYQAAQNAALPAASSEAGSSPPGVEIVDLGEKYRVIAGGRVREYRNPGRDCAYRARVAAVFVALTVDPAALAVEPPPPPSPSSSSPSSASEEASRDLPGDPVAQVDLGVAVDRAMGTGPHTTHGGAGVRVALGRGPLALVIGAMFFTTASGDLVGMKLTQGHYPLDVGVRVRWQGLFFEPYAETGVGLALLTEQGKETATGFEIGAFVAAGIRVPARSRGAFFLSGRGEWIPSPAPIFALPAVGHAPSYWLGAMAGASIGF
jgi:hypothetical protein